VFSNNCIEDEKHVILDCPVYEELRHYLFNHACMYNNKFVSLSDADQFIFLFTNENMCYYSDKIFLMELHRILIFKGEVMLSDN
jgi:hypothetical protein